MNARYRLSFLLVASALAGAAAAAAGDSIEPAPPTAPAGASTVEPWRAVAASGPVDSRPTGIAPWTHVSRGDALVATSHVRTGRRGRATLTRNASILLVDPNSEIVLPAGGTDGNGSVVQNSGSVAYRVDGRFNKNFRVVTPYLVAGVKGTVFLVSVSAGRASVSVEEGTVEVTSRLSGERRDVMRGETLLLEAREGAEMELVREDARGQDGLRRETLRLAESESRRLAAAAERMDADLADDTLRTDDGVLALGTTTLLLEDECELERLYSDDPLKLDGSSEQLLDPIEQVVDDTLQKETTSSTGSGTSPTGSSGS